MLDGPDFGSPWGGQKLNYYLPVPLCNRAKSKLHVLEFALLRRQLNVACFNWQTQITDNGQSIPLKLPIKYFLLVNHTPMISKTICDTNEIAEPCDIPGVARQTSFGNCTLEGTLGNRHAFK